MRKFERVEYAPEDTILPTRATNNSAGYDFYSPEDFVIKPHGIYKFKTGVRAYMPNDEVLLINVRSSIGIRKNLVLLNTQGIIDSDFAFSTDENAGNIMVGLRNLSDVPVEIKKGERVVQGIFVKYQITDNDKPLSDIRTGGVGSSGK